MVERGQNVIITGPTEIGKTFLACALAHKTCRGGYSYAYRRVPRLVDELLLARADGSLARLVTRLARTHVLVLHDWGLVGLKDQERRDMLEVIEERHGRRSTVIATQLPVSAWRKMIGDPTIADAILDRLVHNAHRIELTGKSTRIRSSNKNKETSSRKDDNPSSDRSGPPDARSTSSEPRDRLHRNTQFAWLTLRTAQQVIAELVLRG